MTVPKAVVFDLGKVLLDFDYSIAAGKIAARSDRTAEYIQNLIDHSPLLFRYETGLMTREQFYDEICETTGFRGTLEEFRSIFCDIFRPIEPMIALHATLRARGLPTHIFSNTNDLAIHFIRDRFPFFNTFTSYVLSYEHGTMKPHERLYEIVERQTGCRRKEILYLDDRLENVEAGARRGWQTILQQCPETTRGCFRRLGLLPD